jgi:glycosyltransferase involved in cell wall biosynthesis
MKTALITDWLDKYGGAERVVTAICEIFEFDYYYAYANRMSNQNLLKTFANKKVTVIESNLLSKAKSYFRYFFPIFPIIVKRFNHQTNQNKVNLVISSSWALSKGYRISNEIHICYLQARNFKYVWEESNLYFKGPLRFLSFLKAPLQKFDVKSAQNPNHLISNSFFVKRWVKERYGRDSTVIYPPVDVERFYISEKKDDYFVTVGRLEPYKRFDIIIDAFNKNGKRLIVIGDGSEMKKLRKRAASNIEFLGFLTQNKIKHHLSQANAFIYAGVEDFGIALVEAMASGTPVIAYSGGASQEIIEKHAGLLYNKQSADSINNTIEEFERNKHFFDASEIRKHSLKFSKERFKTEFKAYVNELID